ncbi:MAG: amidase [Gammaproteobacteria bacterium]|nr:amidase [Gammaproteobacteria bacterium]
MPTDHASAVPGPRADSPLREFHLVEATIDGIRATLDAGALSSVELVALYLNRIARYDRAGIALNAVPIINPSVFEDAARADAERTRDGPRGPLHGIPFTVKDSYKVAGLSVAAGSPAFADLVAGEDAFVVARLRAAGAIVLGKTTMPPMAAGGMQRGLYGRAESPYNPEYLAAAWFSGSSNGSGVATAASFASFGLGEETVSSGRSPASNNGLVAYTPSRGVISVRGNWPLLAIRDVVVPHTRTVGDLLHVLNVIVADDPVTRGDLWRAQSVVPIPAASTIRPRNYRDLADSAALRGKRIGVPRIYTGGGTQLARPIVLRPSILALWERAVGDLRALGAEIVDVDLPAIHHYEKLGDDAADPEDRGLVPRGFLAVEFLELAASTWEEFLLDNGDPALPRLEAVDPDRIFPPELRGLGPEVNPLPALDHHAMAAYARRGARPALETPGLAQALRGIERFRTELFDDWMDAQNLDALAFPANTDVGHADADVSTASSLDAWRNGVACSTGNFAIRHLGIPTVTVTMGRAADIGMPVGVTFAGKAYDDNRLLAFACAFEHGSRRREAPPRTPALAGDTLRYDPNRHGPPAGPAPAIDLAATFLDAGETIEVGLAVASVAPLAAVTLTVDGVPVSIDPASSAQTIRYRRPHPRCTRRHAPCDLLVVAVARTVAGAAGGAFVRLDGP